MEALREVITRGDIESGSFATLEEENICNLE